MCKSCNKSIGVCDNGCYVGWEGEFCEKGIIYKIVLVFF